MFGFSLLAFLVLEFRGDHYVFRVGRSYEIGVGVGG
jgi:hypothetical protein